MKEDEEEKNRRKEHQEHFNEIDSLVWKAREAFEDGADFKVVIKDLTEAIQTCAEMKMAKPKEIEDIGY